MILHSSFSYILQKVLHHVSRSHSATHTHTHIPMDGKALAFLPLGITWGLVSSTFCGVMYSLANPVISGPKLQMPVCVLGHLGITFS